MDVDADWDPNSAKQGPRRFTITEKIMIIDRMAKGQSATRIAREYNVNESTIRHIRKREATLRMQANSMTSKVASELKRNRNIKITRMETCLTTWLDDLRAKRLPVWCSKVKAKASQLYELMAQHELFESEGVVATTGWYEKFKKKYNRLELKPYEDRAIPSELEFKTTMKGAIADRQITPSQIFCIETTLFHWKLLPGMDSKEKATMIFSCDASGNFFTQPVLFRKETDPTAKSVFAKTELTESISQQDVRDWFYGSFVSQADNFLKSSNLPDRGIVLVANDPNHPTDLEHYSYDIGSIPPGCNPTCLPTARGILLHFNAVYLKQLSLALKEVVEQGFTFEEAWEKLSVEDATAILKSTVENLDKRALQNGWTFLLDKPRLEFSNDPILEEAATILQNIGLKSISAEKLREQITPRELSNEEIVKNFKEYLKEQEKTNLIEPAEDTDTGPEELDPVEKRMLVNEINQHLEALATARKFFEEKDKNKPRSEAISKRLKQVSKWMNEMVTEMAPPDQDDGIPMDIKIEPVEIEMEFVKTESDE